MAHLKWFWKMYERLSGGKLTAFLVIGLVLTVGYIIFDIYWKAAENVKENQTTVELDDARELQSQRDEKRWERTWTMINAIPDQVAQGIEKGIEKGIEQAVITYLKPRPGRTTRRVGKPKRLVAQCTQEVETVEDFGRAVLIRTDRIPVRCKQ